MRKFKKEPVNHFVSNFFTDVYLTHEDFLRHDQIRSADGFRTTTYSSDLMKAVRRVKGLERIDTISHPKHKYIGKSFIDPFDGKKKTIVEVWEHFGFGNYFCAVYECNGSHGIFTIQSEGTAIEKYFDRERSLLIEEQLK
jgi:hypothetical protein